MPSPELLRAISRLDQAVTRAEAGLEARAAASPPENDMQKAAIAQAIAELDELVATVRGGRDA